MKEKRKKERYRERKLHRCLNVALCVLSRAISGQHVKINAVCVNVNVNEDVIVQVHVGGSVDMCVYVQKCKSVTTA